MEQQTTTTRDLKELYAFYTNVHDIQDTRHRRNAAARNAFMVAARKYHTMQKIGLAVNRDHSTVVHAEKNHENNLRWLPEYQTFYADAMELLKHLDDKNQEASVEDSILMENKQLKAKISKLSNKLHSTRLILSERNKTLEELKRRLQMG